MLVILWRPGWVDGTFFFYNNTWCIILIRQPNYKEDFERDIDYIMFAPKFGTRPIRLTPPVKSMSLNGLTGGTSCSRSGNGHTGLTVGPRVRVELRSPYEFRVVKGFLAEQDLPTL
jgi:hypothetical protein